MTIAHIYSIPLPLIGEERIGLTPLRMTLATGVIPKRILRLALLSFTLTFTPLITYLPPTVKGTPFPQDPSATQTILF